MALFVEVGVPVVDPRDAAFLVVQHPADRGDGDAGARHAGAGSAAQIMDAPVIEARELLGPRFDLAVTADRPFAAGGTEGVCSGAGRAVSASIASGDKDLVRPIAFVACLERPDPRVRSRSAQRMADTSSRR
jgi:hypothetical protein